MPRPHPGWATAWSAGGLPAAAAGREGAGAATDYSSYLVAAGRAACCRSPG